MQGVESDMELVAWLRIDLTHRAADEVGGMRFRASALCAGKGMGGLSGAKLVVWGDL